MTGFYGASIAAPNYHGLHSVRPAGWNYARSDDRHVGCAANEQAQRLVDLSQKLPTPDDAHPASIADAALLSQEEVPSNCRLPMHSVSLCRSPKCCTYATRQRKMTLSAYRKCHLLRACAPLPDMFVSVFFHIFCFSILVFPVTVINCLFTYMFNRMGIMIRNRNQCRSMCIFDVHLRSILDRSWRLCAAAGVRVHCLVLVAVGFKCLSAVRQTPSGHF